MKNGLLRHIRTNEVPDYCRRRIDDSVSEAARRIVDDVRTRGDAAVIEHAVRLGDVRTGDNVMRSKAECRRALEDLDKKARETLLRTAERIRIFAAAQRDAIGEIAINIPGGRAGHRLAPVERAGCYAPGGGFPLPSSVLMTTIPAVVAGVDSVWVASPKPAPVTLAAAALAGAEGVLAVGGAQAIAALAYGFGPIQNSDVVVGPGNKWVTAAKRLVAGDVAIDMLAGPTELVVIADFSSNPELVAADLIAQAEHDRDARAIIITVDEKVLPVVDAALRRQLETMPNTKTIRCALRNGFSVTAPDATTAAALSDRIAPEHVQVCTGDPETLAGYLCHYGSVFIGQSSAEVFGDYGAGPNHVLPTAGTARFTAGLSVLSFLRLQTWLHLDGVSEAVRMASDAAALARLEGLEGHARAAEKRL